MSLETVRTLSRSIFQNSNIQINELAEVTEQILKNPNGNGLHTWLAKLYLERSIDIEQWPKDLRTQYMSNLSRISIYENELRKLQQKLVQYGHEYCPLKGMWLEANVLPLPGLRVFGDIDIWVDKLAYNNIDTIMQQLGFYSRDRLHHRFHFHKEFRKKIFGHEIIFEVHSRLSLNDFFDIDSSYIWANAQRGKTPEYPTQIEILPEHQLIYIFCHSAIHCFDRASRLLDLPLVFNWFWAQKNSEKNILKYLSKWRCRKLFLFSVYALEWLEQRPILSPYFTVNEQAHVQAIFLNWLHSFDPIRYAAPKVHRRRLTDNHWLNIRGTYNPKRVIGALIDRLGYY